MTEREQRLAIKVKGLEDELTKLHRRLSRYEDDDLWWDFIEKVSKSQSKFAAEAKRLIGADG